MAPFFRHTLISKNNMLPLGGSACFANGLRLLSDSCSLDHFTCNFWCEFTPSSSRLIVLYIVCEDDKVLVLFSHECRRFSHHVLNSYFLTLLCDILECDMNVKLIPASYSRFFLKQICMLTMVPLSNFWY